MGNMDIWEAVEKTDPAFTKKVNMRGGFTSIDAHYQIMRATQQFGPIGMGWGYDVGDLYFHDTMIFAPVTLWHGERTNKFGPMVGCEEWKSEKGKVDSDASKKAVTDALTKLLSQLGFSADVFLKRFDDNKYVEQVKKEFAPKPEMITDSQRDIIAGMAEPAGMTLQEICEAFKVKALTEIPASKFAAIEKRLGDKIKERKDNDNGISE